MCGIAGIVRFDGEQVSLEDIYLLSDAVAHRGPDGRGVWFNEERTVAIGHRRLAILDLSEAGRQPMCYEGRYWITFNGEIYNFIELRNELLQRGYAFSTETDTEVILAAYKEWGPEMFHRFNGMWAFGLYDVNEKKLMLARDRFGVKPLYYYKNGWGMIFSSEVQAIHKLLGPDHPLNRPVIADIVRASFLNHGTCQTYLQDVFSLPGGYCLEVVDGSEEVREWYRLKKVVVPASFEDQAVKLRALIDDACKLRLRSDVAVGTCLSGGIDSGSITAVIDKYDSDKLERSSHYTHRSFCAAFPDSTIDESESAKRLAQTLGSALDVVDVNPPQQEELEEAMKQCDGPMHALAFFPIWRLYRYIKQQGITVTLDGQGPDEMLGGYRPLRESLEAAVELGKFIWLFDVYRTYRALGETSQFSSRQKADMILKEFLLQYLRKLHPVHLFQCVYSRLVGTAKKKEKAGTENLQPVRKYEGMTNSLDRSLFQQFFWSPLPGILNQYDRCSMANGVECRMPFMDYRIVEFVFSLPPQSKVGGGYTKRVLREAMKGLLPDDTRLNRLKIGFNAPIVDWFRGPLREFMLGQMSREIFLDSEYFDGQGIKNEFLSFLAKTDPQWDEAWKFWPPVHLVWWLDQNRIEKLC